MSVLQKNLEEAREALKKQVPEFPKYLIVLGSGLSGLLQKIKIEKEVLLSSIPHIRQLTVEGHVARLLIGDLDGTRVACMQGRLHYYEGYPMEDVVFPFRLFGLSGAEVFLLTNAAGGIHPEMKPMDLLLVTDHLNLMGTNPLVGKNPEFLGPRFPDMTRLYDPELRGIFEKTAKKLNFPLRQGVYLALHGPSYETPAEIQMYKGLGADVVGMSTVPEAITLHHMGKRVVAISCITNLAAGVGKDLLVHTEVLENAKKIHSTFGELVSEGFKEIRKLYE